MRITHWIASGSFLALAFTGYVILMCHPRLYWGEAGNDLTPAFLELPISRNYRHGGWTNEATFGAGPNFPRTASRTTEIFNQNSWGRSGHFLAAWILVAAGMSYLLMGIFTRHFRHHLLGRSGLACLRADMIDHIRLKVRPPTGGPQYGPLQKLSYAVVVFGLLPLTGVTGLAMSPAIAASVPFLLPLLGGHQSARTIHFFLFVALMLFLLIHGVMVFRSGFKRQMRAMTWGEKE